MTDLTPSLRELANDCRTLNEKAHDIDDIEGVSVAAKQTLLDLSDQYESLENYYKHLALFANYFPEHNSSAQPQFSQTPDEIISSIQNISDYNDKTLVRGEIGKVNEFVSELRTFLALENKNREKWDEIRTEKLNYIKTQLKVLKIVNSVKAEKIEKKRNECTDARALTDENFKKLSQVLSDLESLQSELENLPEKVKEFLTKLQDSGVSISQLNNQEINDWITNNNFGKNLIVRIKE